MTVKLDERGIQALIHGPIADDLRKRARRVERAAKRYVPVDTSLLRTSIHTKPGQVAGLPVYDVGSNVHYALYVELGTRPHIITPNKKKALFWPGAAHPVKIVHHPGTRPQPYLRPALAAARNGAAG